MSQVRLYLDEDAMRKALVFGLRARNVDVLTAAEANMINRPDEGKRPRITRTRQRLSVSCAVRMLGSSLGGGPVVRQKLGNPGNGMIGDAGENIFEPDERVDSDALTGSHETP